MDKDKDPRRDLLIAYDEWRKKYGGQSLFKTTPDEFLQSLPPQGSQSNGDFINTSRRMALSLLSEAMNGMNEGLQERVSLFIQSQKIFLPESPVGDNK